MVLWVDSNNLPMPYRGWTVAVADKCGSDKQQLVATFTKLLAWLQEYMSVDTVTLLLPTEDRKNLAVYATVGLEEEIVQKIRIPVGQGIAGKIAASHKPKISHNLLQEEIFSPILQQKGLRSLVGVPLPIRGKLVGVLHVGSLEQRQFNERDVQQLQLVVHRLKSIMAQAQSTQPQCNHLLSNVSKTAIWNCASHLAWLRNYREIQRLSIALQHCLTKSLMLTPS